MNKILKYIFFSAFLFSFTLNGETKDSEKLEFIQKGIEYNLQKIKNTVVKYEATFGKQMNNEIKGTWWWENQKEALEAEIYIDRKLMNKFKVVFANSVGKSFYEGDQAKNIPPSGSILPTAPPEFTYCFPRKLFLKIFGENLINVINNGTAQLLGQEKIAGHDCFVLSGKVGEWREYKIWIDYNRDYRPLKIELFYKGKNEGFRSLIQNIQLEKINNIWVPVYGEIDSKDPDIVPVKVRVKEIKVNVELPENIFDIEYPSGTAIDDKLLGTTYYIPKK